MGPVGEGRYRTGHRGKAMWLGWVLWVGDGRCTEMVAAAEVLLIHYVDPLLSDVVPFLVLIAMLVVRPWGLFGTREELDRV